MTDHVYKTIELTGTSEKGIDAAVENAIVKAAATLRNLRWFRVTDIRGEIRGGMIAHWQVTLKLGFTLEEGQAA